MSRDGSDKSAPGDRTTHTTRVQPLPGNKRAHVVTGDSTATGRNTDLATVTGTSTVPDLPADEPALRPGDRVHRYVIEALVGTGGMGAVYRARDPELERPVAVKVVRCKRHADGAEERAHGRLLREAQALARLSHPNVVTVYDAGVLGDSVFLAMELVHGEHLARWQCKHQPPRAQLLRTYIAAGHGLAAAHAAGIVHRDFKPRNVILGDDGRVRVLDFGLAKAMDPQEPNTPASESTSDDDLTRDGAVVGTPRYMSLEQMTGADVDARSDQFSFCVALFEALYGYRPYDARTLAQLAEVMQSHAIRDSKSSSNKKTSPKVPRWLRRVLVRGLSPNPSDRYASMTSLLEELVRVPRRRRRIALATTALLGAAAFATITVVSADASRSTPCANTRANLRGIWDSGRSAAIDEALRSTGRPHTGKTAQLVTAALEDYATRWVTLQHDSCVATHERGTTSPHMMDLQNQCLSRRLHQLELVSDLLSHDVDGDTVDRAVATVASLPDLRDCTESRLLTSGASKPPSSLTARVLETRAQIDQARALFAAGRYSTATPIADRAVTAAIEIKFAPTLAEALLVQGQLRSEVKDDTGAVKALSRATHAAAEAGDDRLTARVWTGLLWVIGYEQEQARTRRRRSTARSR